jgi:hypothetical protein
MMLRIGFSAIVLLGLLLLVSGCSNQGYPQSDESGPLPRKPMNSLNSRSPAALRGK